MDTARDALPDDIAALKEALATERAKALDTAAELAVARAKASEDSALIAQQKLRIAKLERQIYGQRSERSSRLIDQLALTFEELGASATEDELAAERAVARRSEEHSLNSSHQIISYAVFSLKKKNETRPIESVESDS